MPMTPELWSISRIATELALDRRTVAARLRDVAPAGQLRGSPAWRLADVLPVLTGSRRPPPAPPPGCEALAGLSAAEALAMAAMVEMIHAGPGLVSALAVDRGVPAAYGPLIYRVAVGALGHAAREIGAAFGIEADVASLIDAERVAEPDWSRFPGFDSGAAEGAIAELMREVEAVA